MWKRVRRQNPLTRPDVPSDIWIGKWPIGQCACKNRPEQKNENDVPDRGRHAREDRSAEIRLGLCREVGFRLVQGRQGVKMKCMRGS